MSKLKQLFAAMLFVATFATVSPAAAASTCPKGYTGPDSSGICTSTTLYTCELNYQEEGYSATVYDVNLQVNLQDDPNVQNGLIGTLTNNGITFTVTSPDHEECFVTATTKATVVSESKKTTPTPAQTTTPAPKKPTVLANTSADSPLPAVISIIVTAAIATFILARRAKHAKQ